MAYDIAMDINSGDILLQDGDFMLIDNAERIAQQILITLRFWLGEWFLDIKQGVPYLERIAVKNPNLNHIEQIFREKITSVDGVNSILSINLEFDRQNRRLYVEYEAETDAGLLTRMEVLGYGG